jgi:membrane dipeptidase
MAELSASADRIDRRRLLRGGLGAVLGAVGAPLLNFGRCRLEASTTIEVSVRAVDLVRETVVIDMLGLLTLDWPRLRGWQRRPETFGEKEYRELERLGVRVFHPAVETAARDATAGAERWLADWNRLLDAGGCYLARVETVADLDASRARGAIGVVLGFQDSDHFRAVADVERFFALGQRVSQLTYNEANRVGSGCHAPRDSGLTAFGAEVVAAMNRVGMAIDLSHCGERTALDAIAASKVPALVTHANCRALVPWQPRGRSDRLIRALAVTGGVMGITAVAAFVGAGRPTLDDLLAHFEHVARVAGVEHVGLGSDVDVDAREPVSGRIRPFYAIRGLVPELRVYQIADGLLRRGFAPADVAGVLGGNFRRSLGAIWTADAAPRPWRTRFRDPFCPAAAPPVPRTG